MRFFKILWVNTCVGVGFSDLAFRFELRNNKKCWYYWVWCWYCDYNQKVNSLYIYILFFFSDFEEKWLFVNSVKSRFKRSYNRIFLCYTIRYRSNPKGSIFDRLWNFDRGLRFEKVLRVLGVVYFLYCLALVHITLIVYFYWFKAFSSSVCDLFVYLICIVSIDTNNKYYVTRVFICCLGVFVCALVVSLVL